MNYKDKQTAARTEIIKEIKKGQHVNKSKKVVREELLYISRILVGFFRHFLYWKGNYLSTGKMCTFHLDELSHPIIKYLEFISVKKVLQ